MVSHVVAYYANLPWCDGGKSISFSRRQKRWQFWFSPSPSQSHLLFSSRSIAQRMNDHNAAGGKQSNAARWESQRGLGDSRKLTCSARWPSQANTMIRIPDPPSAAAAVAAASMTVSINKSSTSPPPPHHPGSAILTTVPPDAQDSYSSSPLNMSSNDGRAEALKGEWVRGQTRVRVPYQTKLNILLQALTVAVAQAATPPT